MKAVIVRPNFLSGCVSTVTLFGIHGNSCESWYWLVLLDMSLLSTSIERHHDVSPRSSSALVAAASVAASNLAAFSCSYASLEASFSAAFCMTSICLSSLQRRVGVAPDSF